MKFKPNELSLLKSRSFRQGLSLFLLDGCGYALAIAGTIAAPHLRQRIACGIVAGFWVSGLVTVAHDACHQSLTPSRWLNRLLGTLAFLPSLHTYCLWQYGHNHVHHLFTNRRGYDYVWEPLSLTEFQSLSWFAQLRYRFFRTFVGHFFYYGYEVWWKRRFIPRRQSVDRMRARYWVDFLLVVGWLVTLSFVVVVARSRWNGASLTGVSAICEPILLGVALPFVVSSMLSSFSEFLHHTHPSVHWFDEPPHGDWTERQIQTSVHCQFPLFMDRSMHWIMDHTAHHIQPSIPSYHLLEAQKKVETEQKGEVITYPWSLRAMREILRTCKLYDTAAGCWTDYSGNPTSESRFRSSTGSAGGTSSRAA